MPITIQILRGLNHQVLADLRRPHAHAADRIVFVNGRFVPGELPLIMRIDRWPASSPASTSRRLGSHDAGSIPHASTSRAETAPSLASSMIATLTEGASRRQFATSLRSARSAQTACRHSSLPSTQTTCCETTCGTESSGAIPASPAPHPGTTDRGAAGSVTQLTAPARSRNVADLPPLPVHGIRRLRPHTPDADPAEFPMPVRSPFIPKTETISASRTRRKLIQFPAAVGIPSRPPGRGS